MSLTVSAKLVMSSRFLLLLLLLVRTSSGDEDKQDSWYDLGAEMPSIVLPPGRDLADLDYMLEALRPSDSVAP